jgi:succinate-semialdehyde dehydrogenase/glutarate-semialdehyde dehydrogenase
MKNIADGLITNTEPSTGKPVPPIKVSTDAEVRDAVARARAAQARWAALSWAERKRALFKVRDAINTRADELIEVLMSETGKPRFEALVHEVIPLIDMTHYFAKRAQALLGERGMLLHFVWPLKKGWISYEPRGVVGVISPWNFPLNLAGGDIVAALASRNAVVVKPSEWAPRTLMKLREVMIAGGIDPDLVIVLPGDGSTGQAVIEAGVDAVVFTGSVATGRKVGRACGERLIPFIGELGGKDAAIVLPDADVELAAQQVAHAAFLNSGQACASVERVLVHESIRQRFVDAVVAYTERLRQGDPLATAAGEHVDLGAMTVPTQVAIVQRHVDDAKAKGARVLTGGRLKPGPGRFYEPTVLVDVTDDMECWRDETFGPTLPIRGYTDLDEAIRIANATDYGLNAYVFGRDTRKAREVARRLQAGGVVINDFFFHAGIAGVPWGGVKTSGVGRVHSDQGLRDLCEPKFISTPRVPFGLPVRFPYEQRSYGLFHTWVRKLLRGPLSRFV